MLSDQMGRLIAIEKMPTVRVVTPRAGFSAAWRGRFPYRSTARRQQFSKGASAVAAVDTTRLRDTRYIYKHILYHPAKFSKYILLTWLKSILCMRFLIVFMQLTKYTLSQIS